MPATHQRTGRRTSTVASGDFTTHGVIVGMTGSGKTGLGVVLIEEALRAGVPALLIDPKGDLTNLCLTFPDLAPADFRAVGQRGRRAEGRRRRVAEFAAAAGDGVDGRPRPAGASARRASPRCATAADFTIYTPGLAAAVSALNIVGSLQAPADMSDAEVVGDEIEGFVAGLLGLVGIDADPLSSREHILLSNLILNEWSARAQPRPADARRHGAERRRSASSACSSSTSSSRRTTARRSRCGSTACSPRRRSRRG